MKYENEITEEDNNIENSENYKKTLKYLKRNNINDKLIKYNYRIIIEHLENSDNEKSLKKYSMLVIEKK